ncbi:MAG TPA: FKBP-type peptidyl-prolyl cis-trans isomerase [Gemmatimonadaceae bacterium]
MRSPRLLALLSPLAFTACLSGNETGPIATGPSIDCATLATGLAAADSTLITTASGLKYRDVTVGTGATITAGMRVGINYAGCFTPSGVKFDEVSVTNPRDALGFVVGQAAVIAGFDEGMLGMKVGGRRQLVIPPELAYGAAGQNNIPPNATLVFTVDLLAAQ